jgi:DNA-binding FadR family transcriptional regulator
MMREQYLKPLPRVTKHLLFFLSPLQSPPPIWSDHYGLTKIPETLPMKRHRYGTTTVASKHEQIAGSLIDDILSGHYRVGERLPSERDLAARFDANRGACREAMKKLEQMGLAEVQPGGARVQDRTNASLDVMGHLFAQGKLPDAILLDQTMLVINRLLGLAAEQSLELASEEEIRQIRHLLKPLMSGKLDREAHTLARFELMKAIMETSRNLPIQLISRTLFEQMWPNLAALHQHTHFDNAAYIDFAHALDSALQKGDKAALRATFDGFANLNRETMMQALATAEAKSQEALSR